MPKSPLLRAFFCCSGLFFLLLMSTVAFAGVAEIERSCDKMYRHSFKAATRKKICFCVTNNLMDRFTAAQLHDLTQIYSRRNGRFEASRDDKMKAFLEFDFYTHSQCIKDPLWHFPKEDLGQPDNS